ncbi:MAG: 23S rRNA (adenine(2503)-C(2))-methyltransferase RlmN [Phycisphaerales bacterium JB040]
MQHPADHIFDHTPDSLGAWCADRGLPKFRAKQILEWVYEKGVVDPHAMTNLAGKDRDLLASEMVFLSGPTVAHQLATDGTQKLLIEWPDDLTPGDPGVSASEASVDHDTRLPIVGQEMPYSDTSRQTECVMIPSEDPTGARRTACISTQVGCPVGCKFCATGLGGLDGNLSAGRVVEQAWRLARLEGVDRLTNIVFMGMGEPLAIFRATVQAVRTLAAPWGMGISARKITVSTVGLPKAIEKLAAELELPVTLALSLHAPNDELRRKLIPWSDYTTIDELLAACQTWFKKTGREITLEYILLAGVNDQPEHANQLATVAKKLRGNINLIRYNEVAGLPFERPAGDSVHHFQRILRERGLNCHIRASRGRDIAAACGQLRHESAPSGA